MVEEFENEREFRKKFHTGLYICNICGFLTANPYICTRCRQQANQLFGEGTYKYKLKTDNEIRQIFLPIEMKGGNNGN